MTFAIISEGLMDHVVIGNILYGYFNDPDLEINELRPENKEPFGWTKVFEYCGSGEFKGAFAWSDYVIIQIDTDTKQSWKYSNIPDAKAGNDESVTALVNRVIEIFCEVIGKEFYREHKERIIFAIAVEPIECWILPFYARQKAHEQKLVQCLDTLNDQYLQKQGYTIDPNAKGYGGNHYYERATKPLKKFRALKAKRNKNPSLGLFLNRLEEKFQRFSG